MVDTVLVVMVVDKVRVVVIAVLVVMVVVMIVVFSDESWLMKINGGSSVVFVVVW